MPAQGIASFYKGGYSYQVGDCVLIMAEGDPNNEAPYIGRILEIKEPAAPGDDHEIRVCWFYRPEEVLGGRKVFHGQLELYHSDHEDTVAAETIQCHCQVLDLEKFMELEAEEEGPTFFARFSYYPAKRAFKPDRVPVYCKCEMPFNPDVPMVCCSACNEWFHPECLGATLEALHSPQFVCDMCGKKGKRATTAGQGSTAAAAAGGRR